MEVINSSGRRKTSVARVYLTQGTGKFEINKKDLATYFPSLTHQYSVNLPMEVCKLTGQYDVKANLNGGGMSGQADALKLAIAKAIIEIDAEYKPLLKAEDLTTRDSRMVERKKPGQKKARKQFQFSKR